MKTRSKVKSNFKSKLVISTLCVMVALFSLPSMIDNTSMKGGILGKLVDSVLRTISFREELRRRNDYLVSLGFRLPKIVQKKVNSKGIPVMTQPTLATVMVRSHERRRIREEAIAAISLSPCNMSNPLHIIKPYFGKTFRLTDGRSIDFDRSEMANLVSELAPQWNMNTDQIDVFILIAIYKYGGKFSPQGSVNISENLELDVDHCRALSTTVNHNSSNFAVFVASEHQDIMRAVQKLLLSDEVDKRPWTTNSLGLLGNIDPYNTDRDGCQLEAKSCTIEHDVDRGEDLKPNLHKSTRIEYVVKEREENTAAELVPKQPYADKLAAQNCRASWLCNRCLKTGWYGTYKSCIHVCPNCYHKVICQGTPPIPQRLVHFDVVAQSPGALSYARLIPRIIYQTWFEEVSPDRYPHLARLRNSWKNSGWTYKFYTDSSARVWIEKHYPSRFLQCFDALLPGAFKADFFRLLLLLKEGGVYADIDVKLNANLDMFVTPNIGFFVPRDLVAGHRGANFCLWNGLMGSAPGHPIIAKAVERILNIVLNRGDYFDMERDVCHDGDHDTEVWKVRSLDILLLTGPCALGVSVNKAIGRLNAVSKIDLGWLRWNKTNDDHHQVVGDALILSADRYDLGELRFTDPDRNILVASTEQTLISKSAKENYLAGFNRKPAPVVEKSHYSSPQYANDIFGAAGVYTDRFVTNERYVINVKH